MAKIVEEILSVRLRETMGLMDGAGVPKDRLRNLQIEKLEENIALRLELHPDVHASEAGFDHSALGFLFFSSGEALPALEHFKKNLDLAEKYGLRFVESNMRLHIGRCHHMLGKYSEAIRCFQEIADEPVHSPFWSSAYLCHFLSLSKLREKERIERLQPSWQQLQDAGTVDPQRDWRFIQGLHDELIEELESWEPELAQKLRIVPDGAP
jgi:tetratricopeptide (TPR) repeat protein